MNLNVTLPNWMGKLNYKYQRGRILDSFQTKLLILVFIIIVNRLKVILFFRYGGRIYLMRYQLSEYFRIRIQQTVIYMIQMSLTFGKTISLKTPLASQLIIFLLIISASKAVTCPTTSPAFTNCQVCTLMSSNIVCTSCKYAYYLTSASTCALCSSVIVRCASCSSLSGSSLPTCNACEINTALYNGVCQTCNQITGCSNCSITLNNLVCMGCSPGYLLYQSQNQCIKCQIANCSTCSLNSDSTFLCSACFAGYYLLNQTFCQPCSSTIQYCTSCNLNNSVLTCTACASTLLYIANNTCFANCIITGKPNCAVCRLLTLSTSLAICSACQSGYFLQLASKNCLACSQASPGCLNCAIMNLQTTCLSCSAGYFLSGNPAVCVKCNTVQSLCNTCSFNFTVGTGRCTQCVSGYYLNTTDYSCYSCSSNPYVNNSLPTNSCSVCYVNNSMLYCSSCAPKYYTSNGSCLLCSSVILNCDQCGSALTCSVCSIGYLISGSSCFPCTNNYANCLYCNAKQCTDCLTGYYSDDNKQCKANCSVANCLSCQNRNHSQCSSCKTGYILTNYSCSIINCTAPLEFNGAVCTCPPTRYNSTTGCLNCSDSKCLSCPGGICNACLQGFYQNTGVTSCIACQSNCRVCNFTICFLCDDGFSPLNSSCVVIPPNRLNFGVIQVNNLYQLCAFGCVSCSVSLNCSICGRGFIINGSTCVQCPQNCAACNLNITSYIKPVTINGVTSNQTFYQYNLLCLLCDTASALLNNSCVKCNGQNCLSCDNNPQYCLQCAVKYTPNSAGICRPCLSFCDYCDQSGQGRCDQNSCSVGYTWVNQTTCIPCVLGCPSCNSTYPFTCLGCLLGTYLSENNTCIVCQLGCYNCSSSTNCLVCFEYYLLTSGKCFPYCQLPCLSCAWSNAQQICNSCLRGYNLATNGTCLPNLNCTNLGICEYCPLGYFAYRGKCYLCLGNCDYCVFSPIDPAFVISNINYVPYLNCSKCAAGFFLNPSISSCVQCPERCQICLSEQNCLICKNGSFVQHLNYNRGRTTYSTGKCEPCSSTCLTCSISPNRCTSCVNGYNLSSFKCTSIIYINISITLTLTDTQNSDLTKNFKKILNDFYAALGSPFNSNNALVNLISFKISSLLITATASITKTNDSSDLYNSINSNLQNTSKIATYPVAAYSIQPVGFTPKSITSTSSSSSIGLIVGIVIGILMLIILIIVAVWCYRNKRGNVEERSQHYESESVPAASNKVLKQNELYSKNDNKDQTLPKQQLQFRRQRSHISDNNSKPSEYQQKKYVTNLNSLKSSSLPRKSNVPQSINNPNVTKVQKSRIPYLESVDPRSIDKRENIYIPKNTQFINQQAYPISQYESKASKMGHKHTLNPRKANGNRSVSFQQQIQAQNSARIPNESNFYPTVPDLEDNKKSKRKTDLKQKYIPNKNTHFI